MTPGRLLGPPRKVWGITVEKRNFFVNRSVPENFQRKFFSRHVPNKFLPTQDSENFKNMQKFSTLFWSPELG